MRFEGLPEEVLDAVKELVLFIVENFEEILESIKPNRNTTSKSTDRKRPVDVNVTSGFKGG